MSTKSAIANCKKRERQLIESNLVLKKEIVAEERPNHEAVKILMRRYEKFRGGISYLNDNFTSTLKYESDQLRQLEERLEKDLNFLENEVGVLDAKLQERQNQVYVLNNYKDKEYPVKAIRIGELLTEIDQVELANDDEYYDLERVIDDELQKLSREGNQEQTSIKESALNSVLNQMHPSLKEMAKQNQVMQAEIDYHKEQIASLSLNVESLRQEVKQLLAHPKTNVRLQIFPELFKYETKCTPDMDVVLDIPRAELLPI
ncbi:C20orf96 [Bugula neritina]|uniref:C20orf96 n=1 Tax=Bugula neritina TaxID=10212 RepID=A0A7J7J6W7_BUGNE|nr:C20orf96 [Bugula neritina]